MDLIVIGRIQVALGWTNDPVWRHDSEKGGEVRGVSGYPPWEDIGWRAEKWWSRLNNNSYVEISNGS